MAETLNPYIAGNPITGSEMFFGREDVFTFIHQALSGKHQDNVLVLYGQRRTGKTSVLYQMRSRLGEHYLPVFIDLHGMALDGLSGFIKDLSNHISRVLRRDYQIELPPLDRDELALDARSYFETTFLDSVWEAIGDRQLLLMLDEAIRLEEQVQAGKLEPDVFEFLRHLMQHYPRLNFLFSLGSGLEEMEKEYAFLFNVALYKKISFLDRKSAIELITRPVTDRYIYDPQAVERILEVTSGHPYYTQLICHGLFNQAVARNLDVIQVGDVDAMLDEAVERGLAVLKHVWEDSSPAEKVVLAGLSAASASGVPSVNEGAILQAWQNEGVVLPRGDVANAIKQLIARDVITGQVEYSFTVELQRLWVLKYRRLEWVKEEIKDWLAELPLLPAVSRASAAQRPWFRRPTLALPLGILAACIGVIAVFFISRALINRYPDIFAAWTGGVSNPPKNRPGFPEDANYVNSMIYSNGYIWAATDIGLVRWSEVDLSAVVYYGSDLGLPDDCANAIAAAPDGTGWVGCGGAVHVRPDGEEIGVIEYYDRDSNLEMGVVRTLLVKEDGAVWAGGIADEDGMPLNYFDGQEWTSDAPEIVGLTPYREMWPIIRSMMLTPNGNLWLGSEDISAGGILEWGGDQYYTYSYNGDGPVPEDRRVRSLLQDHSGTIWAAANDFGLLRLDPDTGLFNQTALPDYDGAVYVIADLPDGELWVGGDGYVAKSSDGGSSWSQIGGVDDLGEEVLAILQDESGQVWVGMYGSGVSVLKDGDWIALPLQE